MERSYRINEIATWVPIECGDVRADKAVRSKEKECKENNYIMISCDVVVTLAQIRQRSVIERREVARMRSRGACAVTNSVKWRHMNSTIIASLPLLYLQIVEQNEGLRERGAGHVAVAAPELLLASVVCKGAY
jgi:hypothetical protein